MKILLSWLQEFVALPPDVRRLAEDLTRLGMAVDAVTTEEGETVLDLDITTNRPDCLSHYGVARELAALYGLDLKPLGSPEGAAEGARADESVVKIAAPDLCRRYSARILRGVRVGLSPAWIVKRLERVGIRASNNVADATNYVLMECGHPLHAFDMDRLAQQRIIVRRAVAGERFATLDGIERVLTPNDLVIADAARPVALAGVMGGLESEISQQTTNVLLESAWFEPASVRRTSKRLGMHTEASHRFERGADIGATLAAANRCIELIRELAGGELDGSAIDAYPLLEHRQPILLRRSELRRHLGMDLPPEETEKILFRLGIAPQAQGQTGWSCTVPTFRVDVTREIDLVEEVARQYGYDRFPLRLPGAENGQAARRAPRAAQQDRVRELLLALGYSETLSNVLASRAQGEWSGTVPVALENPLSEEAAVLRTSLLPGLLAALQWNQNRGRDSVRLFEVGSVYRREGDGYQEPLVVALAAMGDRPEVALDRPGGAFDFYDLKGDVEQVVELFAVSACDFDTGETPDYYRLGRSARLRVEGETAACLGEVEAGSWKFRQPVYVAEVFLDVLCARGLRQPRARPISRFPAVERDFSILLPESTPYKAVKETIEGLRIPELVSMAPVELFRGEPVPAGRYSLLLRLTLQSQTATLTEAELAAYSARIIERLEQSLGAQIRM